MTTTTSPTLPPELLAKAAEAIRALPMWGDALYPAAALASAALLAADAPGMLAERDSAAHVAEILAMNLKQSEAECKQLNDLCATAETALSERFRLTAERDEALAALAEEQQATRDARAMRGSLAVEVDSLIAERDKARAALAECEDKLDDIINCMGGDENDGWNAPEDVWELAQEGRTIARRVLGKGEV